MDDLQKAQKRNLWTFPLGTVGRDAIYQLFTNFVLTFILFTKGLDAAQILVVTQIMVFARVFDALNDPIMGFIIERTRTRWGKFKPWLAIGMITTGIVVAVIFNSNLTGWNFVVEFGIVYFLYSITYTMHDISYWGMIPSLAEEADARNKFTSRAILFAGIGGTLLNMLVPMLTVGTGALGGSTKAAYGIVASVVCIIAEIFIAITIFGVKEPHVQTKEDAKDASKPAGLKQVVKTISKNKQLLWITIIFLLQQIGNGLIAGGIGSTYIYFQYGYSGGLYSTFSTIGVAATAILMVTYPMISRKIHRKKLMSIMMIVSTVGYVMMLVAGIVLGNNGFWVLTIGYMLANFGQYCFYLIMMISILNTVEYNEYQSGQRDEAIITSVRPFITKMASALYVAVTSGIYLIFNVTEITNNISKIDQDVTLDAAVKDEQIASIIGNVESSQKTGLLLAMVLIPFVLMLASYFLYKFKYTLDEEEYDRICAELAERNNTNTTQE